jgi:hypothetical protein
MTRSGVRIGRGVRIGALLVALVSLAACSNQAASSSSPTLPMCSDAGVHAVAGTTSVPVAKDGTASLTVPVGASVHVTAVGQCAPSIVLAAAKEGTTEPPFSQASTFSPTKPGSTTIKVLWVPCASPATGPAPACALVDYATVTVVAS